MAENETANPWLILARDAYSMSTSFVDNNYRRTWEDAIRHFQNRHAAGSKYHSALYKYRSKIFRPKSRSAIRNNEAAVAAAFFANKDVVSIEPQNPNDDLQQASAAVNQELLNYRLEKTIPWFLICIGGAQEAMNVGVVCSCQEWRYREKFIKTPVMDDKVGGVVVDEEGKPILLESIKVVEDKPVIRLIPVENIRIDPAADWTDPVNSSPYVIELIPMYVKDVKARMKEDYTGEGKWINVGEDRIKSATKQNYDTTRMERDHRREDKYNEKGSSRPLSGFDTVWVHRNIINRNGVDYVYYTLGTEEILSEPKPLDQVFLHKIRPYVIGCAVIEAHRIFANGLTELGKPVQQEINEIANQRMDNVKLVLNKRWIARRGAQVDVRSLVRNVPGSVTLANDPVNDVRAHDFSDVTGSSFQEQDRLNLDFDELVGAFSASTIQSNRTINETVGGMAMLRGSVNGLVEYVIRTISETWVEPVMKQLVKLEQAYESDKVILAIAGERAKLYQKFGVDAVTDELLNQELTMSVNVGFSSTDPIQRVNMFMTALRMIKEIMDEAPPGLKIAEVVKEIFGRIGYKSADRFFDLGDDGQEPQTAQLIQKIQKLEQALMDKQGDRQLKLIETQMKEEGQNKRKENELKTRLMEKSIDLRNPVSGEKRAAL